MIVEFNGKKPRIDDSSFVAPNSTIIGDTLISENTLILYGAICRADFNHIFIGPGSCVQENVVLNPMPDEPIIIEGESIIGYGSIIHGGTIEKNSFIGAGSIILHDVVIGTESIVAAGSMVTAGTKVPPRSLVVGVPGKVVRKLEDPDVAWIKKGVNGYQKLLPEYKNIHS
ncbi:MAG: gamma carbonic anhydrase family protein [Thermodesulfobacteriota bacterium]